jgi:5-methylcytosine-specific restriction endonuclease McrA
MSLTTRCLDCGTRTKGSRCPTCEAKRMRGTAARLEEEPHRALLRTKRWRQAAAAARARDRCCVHCRGHTNLEVHHVRALADGGDPFDLANLITVCRSCHRKLDARRRNAKGDSSAAYESPLSTCE